MAVHELLEFDAELGDAARRGDIAGLEALARQRGFRSLTTQAVAAAATGLTTIAEVLSQLSGIDEARRGPTPVDTPAADELPPAGVARMLGS
jgi:hypothetical protein